MPDKYDQFRIEISKTEARKILDGIVRNYNTVKTQNSKLLARLRAIFENQRYYLNKRLPARKGYHAYEKDRINFLREFHKTRARINALLGRIYVDQEADGQPKFFVKMSKRKVDKLMVLLK